MPNSKKLLQAAAGAAGGAGLDVDEVFSTYIYDGTGSTNQTITNGIDLSGEGGFVWAKARNFSYNHFWVDTERGGSSALRSDSPNAASTYGQFLSFNSDGYDITRSDSEQNNSSYNYASWTFRKAPKFFDVLTYTGTGSTQNISHNLGSAPGMIIVKCTNVSGNDWIVQHRSLTATHYGRLNATNNFTTNANVWGNTNPTESVFTVGSDSDVNTLNNTYIAYLFAHNDGDGEFGPDGNQDIIKCGSYTGNGSTTTPNVINLGFEPQWVLVKRTNTSGSWVMFDNMRGWINNASGSDIRLRANLTSTEGNTAYGHPTATGYEILSSDADLNATGGTYIYMAIRRGPLAEPTSATDVFGLDFTTFGSDGPVFGFANDMFLGKALGNATKWYLSNRLTGNGYLSTDATTTELSTSSVGGWDRMDGNGTSATQNIIDITYGWKRAPKFFDIVTYTGDGTNSRQISHNLGATPQWVLLRPRDATSNWFNWFAPLGDDHYITMTTFSDKQSSAVFFNTADSTSFTLGTGSSTSLNISNTQHIAWLFGSLDGISKVGTYTGNGTSQTIDCGFSTSARWIMIKRYDGTGDWHVWDTEKGGSGGIVAGTEAFLELNTTNGNSTYQDTIDPDSSGFTVHETTNSSVNASGASYIFYALA